MVISPLTLTRVLIPFFSQLSEKTRCPIRCPVVRKEYNIVNRGGVGAITYACLQWRAKGDEWAGGHKYPPDLYMKVIIQYRIINIERQLWIEQWAASRQ